MNIETKEFEVDYKGRMFCGEAEIEWGWEPAQHGGRTDPSWEAYAYIIDVKIQNISWYGNDENNFFEIKKGDRNWLRVNKLLVEVEEKLIKEWEDLEPETGDDGDVDYEPREATPREMDKAQTAYENRNDKLY